MAKMEGQAGRMGLFAILFSISISRSLAADVILNVNTKRPVSVTSDKFLSFTLDPTVILSADVNTNILSTNVERSINMAKALSPAYVRIGGPRSNSYVFERELFPENDERFSENTFSENIWNMVHQWAGKSGLDLITCLAPHRTENAANASWDSRNALDLISFSDHMGYNTSWQLGYECQTRCDVTGEDLGKDVLHLRSILDAFPKYSRSIITGPDVVSYKTKENQQFLLDYFNVAGSALSAITWHPDFSGVSYTDNSLSIHYDHLLTDKENLYKVIGRSTLKKPLWIAESKPEECKDQFIGAVVWARRLGNAAKLGAQVLMRQPDNSNLFKPTPDFWVSLLHKTLVGPEVLDTKVLSGNRTHAHFYCQCTKPSPKYEKGSLTVFGINLTPSKIVAKLNGIKVKELHKYILQPGLDSPNRMFADTVLLNKEPLTLENGKDIPDIKPSVSTSERSLSLKLPSGGIGFWVIPDLKLKSCMSHAEENIDNILLKRLTRRLEENEDEEDAAHEELTDLPEELRPFLRTNRMRKNRKNRLGLKREKDPLFRKLDNKKDLEKLEKLLKRRENYDERMFRNLRNQGGFNIFENPSRGGSSEESTSLKSKKNYNMDSGEEIRAKLEKYKSQLAEYESRKNDHATRGQKSFIDGISETKDTSKAIEALTLISKVENALKDIEPNTSDVKLASLSKNLNLNPENDDDILMDAVLKTDKAKRTIIPTNIEDQVKALYEFLSDEQAFLRRNTRKADHFTRDSPFLATKINRNLKRKFEVDPLRLRREIFEKLYNTPETRGLSGLKFRKRDKDHPNIFDPKNIEGGENFRRFSYQEPIKGFPKGDFYLETSEEKKNPWDNKRFLKKTKKTSGRSYLEPNLWIQDGLEPISSIDDSLKFYGGLWEAEALQNYQNYNFGPENWDPVTNVVNENDYYYPDNIGAQPISAPPTNFNQDIPITQTLHSITKKSRVRSIGEENSSLDPMQFNIKEQENQNKRLKRELGDMNSLLNQEMFHQDDDDCQCRVVRGTEKSRVVKDYPANPDVMIIGSKENIDREEVIEDGSGAHVSEEALEIVENSPILENEGPPKTTESMSNLAAGQMPELREELNKSTVETSNRDTRDSIPSLRQLFRQAFTGKDSSTGEITGTTSGGSSPKGSKSMSNADDSKTHTKGSSTRSIESTKTAEKSTNKSSASAKNVRQSPGGPGLFPNSANRPLGASKSVPLFGITGAAAEKKPSRATKFSLGTGETALGLKKLDNIRLPNLGERPGIEETAANLRQSIEKAGADLRDRMPRPLTSSKRESTNSRGLTPVELPDFPKLGEPPKMKETAEKLIQSIEKVGADLRDRIPPIKPLSTLKRESTNSGILTPAELLDVFKKARENRLAAFKTLREEADKVRTKKASEVLENNFAVELAKFEEFKKKRTEELQQLKELLREKRAEILKTYKPELLDVVKKNKQDLEKHVERREAGVKKIFDDLVQTVDSNLNDNFPPVPNFFKSLHDLRKRKTAEKGDADDSLNLGFFKIPEIFRSKKNVDNEDEVSSEEDDVPRSSLFSSMRDSLPFTFYDLRPKENVDPSDIYGATREDSKNVVEQWRHDNLHERTGSSRDKTWDFVDGRFRRIARSADFNPIVKFYDHLPFESYSNIDQNQDENQEFYREKRDAETQIEETDLKNTAVHSADVMRIAQEPDARNPRSKNKGCNFLCLKTDETELCDGFENKLYKIVRDEGHFTAIPVDNLEVSKSKKKVSLKDLDDDKKYSSSKYDAAAYNPEAYSGLYRNYPIVQVIRPAIPGMPTSQPIQNYWNNEAYPSRKSTPGMYNDYYYGTYGSFPRLTRSQTAEFAPKQYARDFGVGYQNVDSKRSPNPSYPDLMRYQPYTSESHIRRRRQVDNEILESTDKSMNELWSDENQPKSGEDLKDLQKNVDIVDGFGKSQDYPKTREIQDYGKEIEWTQIPIFHVSRDEPLEKMLEFKSGMDTTGSENGAMIISITVTDLSDSQDNPVPLVSSPNFDDQPVPQKREDQVEGSKSSTELENLSDSFSFLENVFTKMNRFLSYLTSWSPNISS